MKKADGRRRVDTYAALSALTAADAGERIGLGDGLLGRVRALVDGSVAVEVTWRYRVGGRTREVAVGTWGSTKKCKTLKKLRADRASMAKALCSGVDPIEQQKAQRLKKKADALHEQALETERIQAAAESEAAAARRITVRAAFARWQAAELRPQIGADGTRTGRKDGGAWVRQAFERRVFPAIGDRAIEDVTRPDLLAVVDGAKVEGKGRTAQVLYTDLRQFFRFAAERELVTRNPLDGICRSKLVGMAAERQRVLSDDELRALFKALPGSRLQPRTVLGILLILATACRVGEAMGAKWEHVDFDKLAWYLPTTKNQRDHTIHLSELAAAVMKALHGLRETDATGRLCAWVFPATDARKAVCIKSFGKQLADRQLADGDRPMKGRTKAQDALRLAGGRWTAHDLRRTAATAMAKLGVSTDVIDECLNHKLRSKTTRVYVHDRREPQQAEAFDKLGAKLKQLIETRSEPASSADLPKTAGTSGDGGDALISLMFSVPSVRGQPGTSGDKQPRRPASKPGRPRPPRRPAAGKGGADR